MLAQLVVEILNGQTVVPAGQDGQLVPEFTNNDHAAICRWLNRTLRAKRPGQPAIKHRLAFEAEPLMAIARQAPAVPKRRKKGKGQIARRHFPAWVSLSGPTSGHPLRLPLAGSDLEFIDGPGNVIVSIERDTKGRRRIAFRKLVHLPVVERTGTIAVGLDKGASIAIVATDSAAEHATYHGQDSGAVLERRSQRSF